MDELTRNAEMSVVGCLIIDYKKLSDVLETGLTSDYFYFDDIRNIFNAILELFSENVVIDFISVLSKIVSKSGNDRNEMKKLIFSCVQSVPATSSAKYYAQLVINSYKARKLYSIAYDVSSKGVFPENVSLVADEMMKEIYDVISDNVDKKIEDISDIAPKMLEDFKNRNSDIDNRSDIGFEKIDSILKGLSSGNLIVLAARPKVGKTAFALSVAKNVAEKGKTVAFYSLEMSKSEIYERLVSNAVGISMNKIIDRKLDDEDLRKIKTFSDNIKKLSIKINDKADITVSEIKSQCRLIKNLGLIIIDYLQLIKPTKKCENRNQEVGAISRELKLLSSQLATPVLCLAQLNRAVIEEKRPSPNDLRDSGEIEQNCNKLMLMWCTQKHFTEIGSVSSKTVGIDVALNRRGNSGVVLLDFNGEFMCFKELEKKYEEKKQFSNWK